MWFVHDLREAIHKSLQKRTEEYRQKQKEILEETEAIQMRMDDDDQRRVRDRLPSEYFDAAEHQ